MAAVRPTASSAEWTRSVIQPATYSYASPAASASLLRRDQRQTLLFGDRDDRSDASWDLAVSDGTEHIAAGIQLSTHTGQQLSKVSLTGHGQHPTCSR